MFIESPLTTIRAPAERNVSGVGIKHVSLLWSDEDFLGVVLSINISSLRDEEGTPGKLCQKR
jgi:hypothetical protein